MATLCKTYAGEVHARQAAEGLAAAGAPGRKIRLLRGSRLRDVRREPVGGFAGAVGPADPVGTYAGGVRLRRQGAGSFAGDPDRLRQGSFADVERVVIATYTDAGERSRVTGHREVRRILRSAAVGDDIAARAVHELQAGHAVLLIDIADFAPSDAQAGLEGVARAA